MTNEIFAIWLCKENTYMMPYLYEMCLASWQVLNPEYKVILYTNNPQFKFNFLSRDVTEVRQIEEYFPGTIQASKEIIPDDVPSGMRFAHRSDYIRYYILAECPGIYVDCDLLCIKPIHELMEQSVKDKQSVVEAYEDDMRICNAFLAGLDDTAKEYFAEIVYMYQYKYVKTSYTFNSIKFPMLLNHKYKDIVRILPFRFGMFYPNWEKNENGDLGILQLPEKPENFNGYGVHLYNTDPKWKAFRQQLTDTLYNKNITWWISKHINNIIDKYIDLMCEAETRDILSDKLLSHNLTELYGQTYLQQFNKSMEEKFIDGKPEVKYIKKQGKAFTDFYNLVNEK